MSGSATLWDLPGPSDFVRRSVELARQKGIVGIVAPPHFPSSLDAVIREHLGLFDLPVIDLSREFAPLVSLSTAFEIELRSARALPLSELAEGRAAMVIGISTESLTRWEATLRAYLAGCSGRARHGAVLLLRIAPSSQDALQKMGVNCLRWQNTIGFRDAMLWALKEPPIEDPVLGRLAIETAVALAGWELEEISRQIERLHANPKSLFEIPVVVREIGTASWALGEADQLDGVHFTRFSASSADEISHRVWRAQVTVLFGWLESVRITFVQSNLGWLNKEAESRSAGPLELEWGDLCYIARQRFTSTDKRRQIAESARNIRNALAHGEVVGADMFNQLRRLI